MAHGYKEGGWEEKYHITKRINDGDGHMVGVRFTDPEAMYFVMRYDTDPHARRAMRAYAESITGQNAEFAMDIHHKLLETAQTEGGQIELAELMEHSDKVEL